MGVLLLGIVGLVAAGRYFQARTAAQGPPGTREVIEITPRAHTSSPSARLRVEVIATYPHDSEAFTQGLLWDGEHLLESTGLRGRSTLRRVRLRDGAVLRSRSLSEELFAEGLARVGPRLIQLSWTSGQAQVWNAETFAPEARFEYEGEGWGLCFDGARLVMSDGSARLTFRNATTFAIEGGVTVTRDGRALRELNELECVDGAIWANVWQADEIVRIDPADGRVLATVDASGLLSRQERREADVLNGIAWSESRGHFFITGKFWPHVYEVDFVAP